MILSKNAPCKGQAISLTQIRPFCCSDFSAKKSANLSSVFGWNSSLGALSRSFSCNKNRKNSALRCFCTKSSGNNNGSHSLVEWDWNKWSRHFFQIEQAESYASVLKFQLEEAIEKEDFEEAAKLKQAIEEASSKDTVAEIMSQLKNAIIEERYHDASRLSRDTGAGLVGWWVGYSYSDDPFGRIVHITPAMGRFIARSYNPRQLVNGSPGTPLFEIFVVKEFENSYRMQVVYMQRSKGSSASAASSAVKSTKSSYTSDAENASVADIHGEVKVEGTELKGINIEEATEEGMKSLLKFLRDKIPGFKVKVMKIDVSEELADDGDSLKQLNEDDRKMLHVDDSEDEHDDLEDVEPDGVALGEGGKELETKLFIGGVVHRNEDSHTKEEYVRVPAEIRDVDRDSFVLHVPRSLDKESEESKVSKEKAEAIAAQGALELMPPDVAKLFFNANKASSKVSREMLEIVKLAINQAQKMKRESEYTTFNRIYTQGNLDPFDGLYVGAFGPYGAEIVQLRRRYGHWNDVDAKSSDVKFFEFVEAVKLTGDLNVPAGKVTFRAKIGKDSRVPNRGMYPDEIGVVASYKGQGRISDSGFRNPRWVEGELLQLNGKGMNPYVRGADIGFLYEVPGQSFLVLFNRLKLPE